jgi:hypothetical protein
MLDYLARLLALFESLVKRCEDRIATARAEGSHVQYGTHLGPPAAEAAFAFHRATVARPRGQASQGGGAAAIHGAQLGQEHQRQQRGPKTHPLDLGHPACLGAG